MRPLSIVAGFALLSIGLSGCLAPSPFSVATMVAGAHSYAVSGKTLTDHGISGITGQDCVVTRLATEGAVCRENVTYAAAPDILQPLPTKETSVTQASAPTAVQPALVLPASLSGDYLRSAPLTAQPARTYAVSPAVARQQIASTGYLASGLDQY